MPRYKLFIEYQGTRYSGWQIQKNARTVQGDITDAIRQVTGRDSFELYGAGRTDAGVHALEQVAHLELEIKLDPEALQRRINVCLPADINILRIEAAHPRFHARHHALSRSYVYQISRRRTAFAKKFVWWVKEELELEAMRRSAALFVGMHNYRSFAADDEPGKSTKALVDRVDIGASGALILIRVEGSHFLWKMVRRIVGVLVAAGRNELGEDDVRHFLRVKSEEPAGLAAPASGLFLEKVYYEGDAKLTNLTPAIPVKIGDVPPVNLVSSR